MPFFGLNFCGAFAEHLRSICGAECVARNILVIIDIIRYGVGPKYERKWYLGTQICIIYGFGLAHYEY